MNRTSEHQVIIGVRQDGVYLAATDESPRFCFEASSFDEAVQIAKDALTFYVQTKKSFRPSTTRDQTVTTLVPVKRFGFGELVPA